VWVDYDVPSETTYTETGQKIYAKLYGGKVVNEAEKNLKFAELQKKAKQLIDNNISYLNELTFKYARKKYPLI
jgi:hypothetical protein